MNRVKLFTFSALTAVAGLLASTHSQAKPIIGDAAQQAPVQGSAVSAAPLGHANNPAVSLGAKLAASPIAVPAKRVASGASWTQYEVNGTFRDVEANADRTFSNSQIVVVRGLEGLKQAPISDAAKADLTNEVQSALNAKTVSSDQSMLFIVDLASSTELGSAAAGAKRSRCGDKTKEYDLDQSYSKQADPYEEKFEKGNFIGTLKATVSTSASAGAWITLKVKRFWTPFGCVPWGAGLIDVGVQGQASADATLEATGSFKINGGNPWTYSKLIAAPKVAEFPFAVGPIPIALAISVPIETGFTVDAATTAALKGKVHAEGSFKYSCTLDNGCDGTKDFSAGFTPNGDPSGQAASKVNVEPWVQGSIRLGASVLTAEVAYAQIGVRPGVSLDLRAYAGNTCGDANGDGTVDAVAGASIDMGARVDLIAKVGALGESKEWSYRLLDKHLGFFKTGTTNAPWSPMYRVKGTDDLNATISLGTRPCWPYTDPVTYQITWDDGTTSSGTQGPGMHDVSHTFKGYGGHPFTVALQSDSSGRSLGTSAAANVYLKVIQQAPNHGLSMSTK